MSEDAFVALITTDQPAAPQYFHTDAALNKSWHPILDLERRASTLPAARLRAELASGTRVIHARPRIAPPHTWPVR